jgi:hypothetical protein
MTPGFQVTELYRSHGDSAQTYHSVADVFKHPSDLAISTLPQNNLVPAILAALYQLNFARSIALASESNPLSQLIQV